MSNPSGCQYCQQRYHRHDRERGVGRGAGETRHPGTGVSASRPTGADTSGVMRLDGVLAGPKRCFQLQLFPLPNFLRFLLFTIPPQPFSLLSPPEGSSWGLRHFAEGFLFTSCLWRGITKCRWQWGAGWPGGHLLCLLVEELLCCSASLPLPPPPPAPCYSSQGFRWSWALVVSPPLLSGQGESNLGCQVAREGRASPLSQLSDNEVIQWN